MIDNLEVLVKNKSYYQWEYDYNDVTAEILLDKEDNSVYLEMKSHKVKSGLGKGSWTTPLELVKIGNLNTKIDTALVRTLLKKHKISQHNFSQHWEDKEGNLMSLTEVFLMYSPEKTEITKAPKVSKLKHIKSINTFDKKDNIEIIKYSDKAYAIFGEDTRKIKDDLLSIGCRYNKFLTDPKTGQKRVGWICSNSKIDLVKELI